MSLDGQIFLLLNNINVKNWSLSEVGTSEGKWLLHIYKSLPCKAHSFEWKLPDLRDTICMQADREELIGDSPHGFVHWRLCLMNLICVL